MNAIRRKVGRSVLSTLVYGLITGIICGIFMSLFLVCSKIVLEFSFGLYENADGALAVVCMITLALLCCLLTAVIQTLCPRAKGSGIPLAEGTARGMLRVKWLSTAAALIAGSLLAFLSGMPLGSEGPSVGIGGLIGEGVGKTAKKPTELRRHLITGGACAGLAAAFNAPLTGICFAFEETHRRFSPYIFASALSAVIGAVFTSQLAFYGFSHVPYLSELGIAAGSCQLAFLKQTPFTSALDTFIVCGAAAVCGIVCAAFGTAFNRLTEILSKLFGKIKSATLRLLPAFLLAAVCGLSLYMLAGSGEATLKKAYGNAAVWLLITLLVVRFITTAIASGSGATGGLFLPMIAIGGLIGTLAAKTCVACGMNEAYTPNITIMCICAYFASSVRAPITAVALSVELTFSFANLLPCVIAVAVATLLTDLSGTEPLYERMLGDLSKSVASTKERIIVKGIVLEKSHVACKRVANVLWPFNSLVTEICRQEKTIVPDGETTILEGDALTVCAENVDPAAFYEQIKEYIQVREE